VLADGPNYEKARVRAKVLVLRVIADRLEHGEREPQFEARLCLGLELRLLPAASIEVNKEANAPRRVKSR
jgi:hypothetical protein